MNSLETQSPHGPWYVAQRAASTDGRDDAETSTACTQCGEGVWIDEPARELAESCSGVVCCDCTGTAHGILLIPNAGLEQAN